MQAVRHLAVVYATACLICLPWLVRNYNIYGDWSMVSTSSEILWKGIIYGSGGGNHLYDGRHYSEVLTRDEKKQLSQLTVNEQKDFFMDKYLYILKNDPLQVAKMYLLKLKNFWWFRDMISIDYPQEYRRYVPFYKIYYVLCLVFVIVSICFLKKKVLIVLTYPFVLSLMQSAYYVETRHRIIIEPFLIFLAMTGVFLTLYFVRKNILLRR